MRMILALAAVSVAACGCAAPPAAPEPLRVMASFDELAAKAMLQPGRNEITGSALIRQRGGGVVTCAGGTVNLIPATDYAVNRLTLLYGNGRYLPAPSFARQFDPDPPAFKQNIRTTLCNAQGFFRFDDVQDGDFYVQTTVLWQVAGHTEGGGLLQRVSLKSGQRIEVTLTP